VLPEQFCTVFSQFLLCAGVASTQEAAGDLHGGGPVRGGLGQQPANILRPSETVNTALVFPPTAVTVDTGTLYTATTTPYVTVTFALTAAEIEASYAGAAR